MNDGISSWNTKSCQMNKSPEKKMSTTAKVVVFIVVSAVILLGVLALDIYLIANKVGKEVTDPASVHKAASAFIDIKEPLPSRFRYLMCLNFGDIKTVSVEDRKTGATYTLVSRPFHYYKQSDEALLNSYVEHKETFGLEHAGLLKGFRPTMRGHTTVGNEEMPYAVGDTYMGKFKISQFVGLVTPANNLVIILGQSEAGGTLELDDVKAFLQCIEGFTPLLRSSQTAPAGAASESAGTAAR